MLVCVLGSSVDSISPITVPDNNVSAQMQFVAKFTVCYVKTDPLKWREMSVETISYRFLPLPILSLSLSLARSLANGMPKWACCLCALLLFLNWHLFSVHDVICTVESKISFWFFFCLFFYLSFSGNPIIWLWLCPLMSRMYLPILNRFG